MSAGAFHVLGCDCAFCAARAEARREEISLFRVDLKAAASKGPYRPNPNYTMPGGTWLP